MKGMISVCLVLLCLSWTALSSPFTIPGIANGDQFGTSVAVMGPFVLVGAPAGNGGTGAAYLYMCDALATGCQAAANPILPSDSTPGQAFGASVSMAPWGNDIMIAIGAPGTPGSNGATFVFSYNGLLVSLYATINGTSNGNFGAKVAATNNPLMPGDMYVYVSEPLAKKVHFFNCSMALTCGFGVVTTQVLTNTTLQTTDGFGTVLSVLATGAFIGAPGRASSVGSVFVFNINPATGAFTQYAEIMVPGVTTPLGFGSAIALGFDLATFSALVSIGSMGGLVLPLTCSVATNVCTPGAAMNRDYLTKYGASLATVDGILFVGASNSTHATAGDGEVYVSKAGMTGSVLSVAGSKKFGSVLAAYTGSNLLAVGADVAPPSGNSYVYVFAANITVTPTAAPTSAPTTAPTTAPRTTSGASSIAASFLFIAFLIACQLLF